MVDERREAEVRELRLSIARMNESRKALEGLALVLGDGWAQMRLGELEAGISEKTARLTTLSLEQPSEARR